MLNWEQIDYIPLRKKKKKVHSGPQRKLFLALARKQEAQVDVRTMVYKLSEVMFHSPCVVLRPQLEKCFLFWSPHFKKDTDNVERIQRRATEMIRDLENVTYKERLKELGLFSLEKGRLRGNVITSSNI